MSLKISQKDVTLLIKWARRYCDIQDMKIADDFNLIVDRIFDSNPSVEELDERDRELSHGGYHHPYALGVED